MKRFLALASLLLSACATKYNVVLRNATLYDGSGKPAITGDLAIRGDRIAAVGEVRGAGKTEIDVHSLAVAPGFINVMSQAQESLIADGRGLSDTKQGVTTEIFGEGESMGPLSAAMKKELVESQADIKYPAAWTTLREYLDWLQHRGVTPNIGSFLGAATPRVCWENLLLLSGGADRVLLVGFKSDALKPLTGKTLAEVAKMRGVSPEDAAIDLVIEDGTRVSTIYFLMSDDNLRKQIALPYVSFGSDADSSAPEGVFLKSSNHPRAYGNFANLLGRYVRDEHVIPLAEAVRRLTSLPAQNLGIANRGFLKPGNFADVVVFDPATIAAQSTYEKPMRFATGVVHVFVNGVQVLKDGEHTGAKAGRVRERTR